ncbi:MAG: hypothetical protein U0169_13750 [Polyangiaceae bacterium]
MTSSRHRMRPVVRSAAATIGVLTAGILPNAHCGPPEVSLEVAVPSGVKDETAWIEVGVFENACPPIDQLAGGIPEVGPVSRLAFRPDSPTKPPLGELDAKTYGFAAVARRADCGVVATGCVQVNVGSERRVGIQTGPTGTPSGMCGQASVCHFARCTPGVDNSSSAVGAACSMQLLGAGPLAAAFTDSGSVMSVPSITALTNGFAIAYREFAPVNGSSRLTLLPIDEGGGAMPAVQRILADRCSQSEEGDGAAVSFDANGGIVALARARCGSSKPGGIDLFSFDDTPRVQSNSFNLAEDPSVVTLSGPHALVDPKALGPRLLAFVQSGRPRVTTLDKLALTAGFDFGGGGTAVEAQVAATDKVVGLLARGAAGSSSADGGTTPGDPTTSANELRLQMTSAGSNLASLPAPYSFTGAWASMAAQSTRVFVVAPGAATRPLVYRAFDLQLSGATPEPKIEESFTPEVLGKVLYADVTVHNDRIFMAVEQAGSISVVVFDHASTTPTFVSETVLARDPRVPSYIGLARDGRLAIAASDTRVAVAWVSARVLKSSDVPGGYAIFACRSQ